MSDSKAARPDADEKWDTLTIHQETKVGWFDVRQLFATGVKTLVSTIVGSMSGRREVMAALDPRPLATLEPDHKYDDKSELWIDYVADTGDGWNATYSIAYLVGRDALYLRNDLEPTPQPIANSGTAEAAAPNDPGLTPLPGGTVLILGGDQVYPTASASAYQNRLQDPFRCARPGEGAPKRDVYAIPGNHDWYDGLTAFIRLFCQRSKRTTGTWLTQQRRSYFAIRIREGWWLWAADLALDDDLDPPQLDYFTDQSKLLKAGDRVILCLPAPTWVTAFDATAREQPEVSQQADKAFLIKKQVTDANARIVLALAGDLHHYARHEAADGVQFITCGGGGAYTLGTIRQPETIHCSNGTTAQLRRRFPSDAESRALRWWSLLFPVFSPGFTALLTVYQLLLLYFLHSVSRLTHLLNEDGPPAWLDHLANTPLSWHALPGLLLYAMQITLADSMTFLYAFALVGGCIAFARLGRADPKRKADWIAAGTCHGLLQLLLAFACCWFAARLTLASGTDNVVLVVVFTALAATLVFIVGGLLFGAYLLVTNLTLGLHEQEVFSCQSIEQYKCFLRIRIEKDRATVYPIGLRRPGDRWKPAPGVKVKSTVTWPDLSVEQVVEVPPHTKRIYDPVQPLQPQLIENPIEIR